jgi:WD40 repeat protein
VWDLETGACLATLKGHFRYVWSIAFHADGRRAVAESLDHTLGVWDLTTGECLNTFKGCTFFNTSVTLTADGQCAVTAHPGAGGPSHLWELNTGACLRTFESPGDSTSVALLPDGRRMVTWRPVQVWDLETGACLHVLEGHTGNIMSFALHPDGQRAVTVGQNDDTVRLWDLGTGACIGIWFAPSVVKLAVGRSVANGRAHIVAGCEDGSVLFFELMPPGPLTRTTLATWSPAHPLVATALDTGAVALHQWHPDSAHLEEIARLAPTTAPISSLRFSLDGTRLQLLSPEAPERILDATTLQPAAAPTCAWPAPLATSPDGAWRADIENGRLKIVPASS